MALKEIKWTTGIQSIESAATVMSLTLQFSVWVQIGKYKKNPAEYEYRKT